MADAPILGAAKTKKVKLDDAAFGARFNGPLVHESVRAELNARRQGTASTKTRGKVRGGGAKPWRQKGTGRARAGSSRSPIWTGGGMVFGPQPRHYTFKVNRKERRAALRSALSAHAERGTIAVLDPSPFDAPSTKQAARADRRVGRRRLGAGRPHRGPGRRGAVLPQPAPRLGAAVDATSASPTSIGAASLLVSEEALDELTARAKGEKTAARRRRGGAPSNGPQPGHHPPRRQREELRARRHRQVHLPRPSRRAQDADPPGRRGALRRQGRRRAHRLGQVQAQAPRPHRGAHAQLEEGDRAGARRATRSRSSRACRASRADPACPFASPSPRAPAGASRPTRTSRRSRRPTPRSRSSRASRSPAGATPTAARPRAIAAAGPSACTARSTSSAARTASRPRSPRSSTTRTARRTSRCCTTPTASRPTSSRPTASRSA